MGSINYIYNPCEWKVKVLGGSKLQKDATILQATIGECDDHPAIYEITILISEFVYNEILNNNFSIKKQAYSENPIKVFDKKGNEISLITGEIINNNVNSLDNEPSL